MGEETWDPETEVPYHAEFTSCFLTLNLFLPCAPPDGLARNCFLFPCSTSQKVCAKHASRKSTLCEQQQHRYLVETTSVLASQPSFLFCPSSGGTTMLLFQQEAKKSDYKQGPKHTINRGLSMTSSASGISLSAKSLGGEKV